MAQYHELRPTNPTGSAIVLELDTYLDTDEYDLQRREWKDMPEFIHENLTSFKSIIVHFENSEDMREFSELIGQNLYKSSLLITICFRNRERRT